MTPWLDQAEFIARTRAHPESSVEARGRRGRVEHIAVKDGLFCGIYNWESAEQIVIRAVIRDCIGLQFVQAGRVRQTLAGHGNFFHTGARLCVTTFPDEVRQVRAYPAGEQVRYVGAWVTPSVLVDDFGLDPKQLAAPLRAFFEGDRSIPACMSIPLSPHLWMTLDDILSCSYSGKRRQTYLGARMRELLCHGAATLERSSHGNRPPEEAAVSSRELLLIETAAAIYVKELHSPPSVNDLSTRLGLNRNKLTAGFQEVFGCTPHEYGFRARMRWANHLLTHKSMAISEVARAVGYTTQSAFSRAYTNHFESAPSLVCDIPRDTLFVSEPDFSVRQA